MSKSVDERVVSMQFDNKQFEQNVKTSMSTLDKFKKSLNFDGASKGIEQVTDRIKKFDTSPMTIGLEKVKMSFSALEVMGITALSNITTSVMQTGKRIVDAFTIDPVKSGFQEYETQINAVQTILANTSKQGTTLKEVNQALDELNTYADLTIYNFTEMTKNIGTFTAAGLDLDTSVKAIQGIANLAAVSGSTSQQASTAMYQLSQALSAGTVQLMDWNSVVNAGMGGKVFQDAIIQTGKEMGALNEEMVEAYENGASFRQLLDASGGYGKWFTSDILSTTLGKFTKTGVVEYMANFANVSYESMEALQKLGDETNYTGNEFDELALSIAEGDEALADNIKSTLKMASTAEDAATKVKTFSQLMDTLKEAAQSGWTQTWEILIGDFEEAKSLFTEMHHVFSGIIDATSKARNDVLSLALSSKWNEFSEKVEKTGVTVDALKNNIVEAADEGGLAIGDLIKDAGSLEAVIANGRISSDMFRSALSKLSEEELENLYATEKDKEAIDELIDLMTRPTGRTYIIDAFRGALYALGKVIKTVGEAYEQIFPPKSTEEKADKLYAFTIALSDFTAKLIMSDETADKVRRTFAGLFAIVDLLRTVIGGGLGIALKLVTAVLSKFGMSLLDVTAIIGDFLVIIRDIIKEYNFLGKAINYVATIIANAITSLSNWIRTNQEFQNGIAKLNEFIKKSVEILKEWGSVAKSNAKSLGKFIVEGLVNGLNEFGPKAWNTIKNIANTIITTFSKVLGIHSPSKVFLVLGGFIILGLIKGLTDGFPALYDTVKEMGTGVFENTAKTIKNAFESLSGLDISKLVESLSGLDISKILAILNSYSLFKLVKVLKNISDPLEGLSDVLESITKSLRRISRAKTFEISMKGIKSFAIALLILAGALVLLTYINTENIWEAVTILGVMAVALGAMTFVLTRISGDIATINLSGASIKKAGPQLIGIAISILLIARAVEKIGSMDVDKASAGMTGLSIILGELILFMYAYGKAVGPLESMNMDKAGKMFQKLGTSILIIAIAMKLIGGLNAMEITKGIAFMTLFEIFAIQLMAISAVAGENADKAGSMLLKFSIAMGVLVIVFKMVKSLSPEAIVKGIGFMALFEIFVGTLILITNKSSGEIPKVSEMLLSLSASMLLLTIVMKSLRKLSLEDMVKGEAAILGFTGIIALLLKAVKSLGGDAPKIAGTILAMSVSIGIMAGVATILSLMPIEGLAKGIIAVGLLGTIMSGMIKAAKDVSEVKGSLIVMTVAIGIMVGAITALSFLDTKSLLGSSAALSAVMGMFALMEFTAKKIDPKAIIGIGILEIVVVSLALIIQELSNIDANNALKVSGSISLLLLSMSASLVLLKMVGQAAVAAIKGVAILIGAVAVLGSFAVAVGALAEKYPEMEDFLNRGIVIFEKVGEAIGAFFGGLITGFTNAVLNIIPKLGQSLSDFSENAKTFVKNIMDIDDPGKLIKNAGALSAAILALSLADLVSIVGSLGGLGFASMGWWLSNMMENIQPFLDSVSKVDTKTVENAKNLAEMLGILTAVNLSENNIFTKFITGGGLLSGGSYKEQLKDFGEGIAEFSSAIKGKVDTNAVNAAAAAGKTLAELSKTIPSTGDSIISKIVGQKDLGAFGNQLKDFGTAIVEFSKSVTNEDGKSAINENAVKAAKNAGELMATLANDIPTNGSILMKWLAGEKNLSTFGSQLEVFGTSLVNFSSAVSAEGAISSEAVESAKNAGLMMSELANNIPSNGGFVFKLFSGEQNLAKFGEQIEAFGTSMIEFSKTLTEDGTIDAKAVESAKNAGMMMSELQNALPKDTSWWEKLIGKGTQTLKSFGEQIAGFGTGIAGFAKNVNDVNTSFLNSVIKSVGNILDLFKDMKGFDNSGVNNFSDGLEKIGNTSINNFIRSFRDGFSRATDAINDLFNTMSSALANKNSAFMGIGLASMMMIASGFSSGSYKCKDAMSSMAINCVRELNSYNEWFYDAGVHAVDGFANGITDRTWRAEASSRAMANAAYESAIDELDIHSPSRVFREMGGYIPEGLAEGIDEMSHLVNESSIDMAQMAIDGTKNALVNIGKAVDEGLEMAPSIRPVLDISSFDTAGMTLTTNVRTMLDRPMNSMSRMMYNAQNEINASNAKVIDAISGLRDDMSSFYADDNREVALYVDSRKMASALVNPMNRQLNNISIRQGGL